MGWGMQTEGSRVDSSLILNMTWNIISWSKEFMDTFFSRFQSRIVPLFIN